MGESECTPVEQYERALRLHDWYHGLSDDRRKSKKGRLTQANIVRTGRALRDPDLAEELWKKHAPKLAGLVLVMPNFR